MDPTESSAGALLRKWRQRRRLSQLMLASEAEVSQRHLSCVESGRSAPSREMVLRLARHLDIPLRERNALLVAAGFAPLYRERALDAPELAAAREAVRRILTGHEPHPALAVDRYWNLVDANRAVLWLMQGVDPALLTPPVNVLRVTLHPQGLAPRLRHLREWRAYVIGRLLHMAERTGDLRFTALMEELKAYPQPAGAQPPRAVAMDAAAQIAVPFALDSDFGPLSFITTTTVFGTAAEVTLSELVIESMFPADAATAATMRRIAQCWDAATESALQG